MARTETRLDIVPPEGLTPAISLSQIVTRFNHGPHTVDSQDATGRHEELHFGAERYHIASLGFYSGGQMIQGAMYVGRGRGRNGDGIRILRFTMEGDDVGVSKIWTPTLKGIDTLTDYDMRSGFGENEEYSIPSNLTSIGNPELPEEKQRKMLEELSTAVGYVGLPPYVLLRKKFAAARVGNIFDLARVSAQPAILNE